jgi:hypothetical protein
MADSMAPSNTFGAGTTAGGRSRPQAEATV